MPGRPRSKQTPARNGSSSPDDGSRLRDRRSAGPTRPPAARSRRRTRRPRRWPPARPWPDARRRWSGSERPHWCQSRARRFASATTAAFMSSIDTAGPAWASEPKTASMVVGEKTGAGFSNTPSGVSSTIRRVPPRHCRRSRIALGRMNGPFVERTVVRHRACPPLPHRLGKHAPGARRSSSASRARPRAGRDRRRSHQGRALVGESRRWGTRGAWLSATAPGTWPGAFQ